MEWALVYHSQEDDRYPALSEPGPQHLINTRRARAYHLFGSLLRAVFHMYYQSRNQTLVESQQM